MAQNRRSDDMSIQLLLEKFDNFETKSEERHRESMAWRETTIGAIRTNSAEIRCLSQHFSKYKPQLEEGLNRRKWWREFWEARRQEIITNAVRGGFLTLCGLVIYALSSKFIAWVRSVVSNIA